MSETDKFAEKPAAKKVQKQHRDRAAERKKLSDFKNKRAAAQEKEAAAAAKREEGES